MNIFMANNLLKKFKIKCRKLKYQVIRMTHELEVSKAVEELLLEETQYLRCQLEKKELRIDHLEKELDGIDNLIRAEEERMKIVN